MLAHLPRQRPCFMSTGSQRGSGVEAPRVGLGFGRVGQAVCDLLTAKLVRYKAFDMDPYRVAEARKSGLPVFYGDARRLDVIQAFIKEQEKAASAIVITLDSEKACTTAVRALLVLGRADLCIPLTYAIFVVICWISFRAFGVSKNRVRYHVQSSFPVTVYNFGLGLADRNMDLFSL